MKAKPHTRLTPDVDEGGGIFRFAFVDEGDNPGAKGLTMKGKPNPIWSALKRWAGIPETDPRTAFSEECAAFLDSVKSILDGPSDDEGARLKEVVDAFKHRVSAIKGLTLANGGLDSLSAPLARGGGQLPAEARRAFVKAVSELGIAPEEAMPEPAAKMSVEEALAMVPDEAARMVLQEAMAAQMGSKEGEPVPPEQKAEGVDSAPAADGTVKLAPEHLKRLEDAEKRAKDAEDKVAAMEKARAREVVKAKAAALIKEGNFGVDVEKLADTLEKDPASEETLKAIAAQSKAGAALLKVNGRVGDDTVGDATKRLNDEKARLQKEKGLPSPQAAMAEIAKTAEGKKLIAEAHAEQSAA